MSSKTATSSCDCPQCDGTVQNNLYYTTSDSASSAATACSCSQCNVSTARSESTGGSAYCVFCNQRDTHVYATLTAKPHFIGADETTCSCVSTEDSQSLSECSHASCDCHAIVRRGCPVCAQELRGVMGGDPERASACSCCESADVSTTTSSNNTACSCSECAAAAAEEAVRPRRAKDMVVDAPQLLTLTTAIAAKTQSDAESDRGSDSTRNDSAIRPPKGFVGRKLPPVKPAIQEEVPADGGSAASQSLPLPTPLDAKKQRTAADSAPKAPPPILFPVSTAGKTQSAKGDKELEGKENRSVDAALMREPVVRTCDVGVDACEPLPTHVTDLASVGVQVDEIDVLRLAAHSAASATDLATRSELVAKIAQLEAEVRELQHAGRAAADRAETKSEELKLVQGQLIQMRNSARDARRLRIDEELSRLMELEGASRSRLELAALQWCDAPATLVFPLVLEMSHLHRKLAEATHAAEVAELKLDAVRSVGIVDGVLRSAVSFVGIEESRARSGTDAEWTAGCVQLMRQLDMMTIMAAEAAARASAMREKQAMERCAALEAQLAQQRLLEADLRGKLVRALQLGGSGTAGNGAAGSANGGAVREPLVDVDLKTPIHERFRRAHEIAFGKR